MRIGAAARSGALKMIAASFFLVGVGLAGCVGTVEDFVLLRFQEAQIDIYLPSRESAFYQTGLLIKENDSDVLFDGNTRETNRGAKRVFHLKGKGVVQYGDAEIIYAGDRVSINGRVLGMHENERVYTYVLAPDGHFEPGQVLENY